MPRQFAPTRQAPTLSRFASSPPEYSYARVSSAADRVTRGGVLFLILVTGACGRGKVGEGASDGALADTLKAAIQQAYDFSRPGVLERMAALYPDSGRVISASGGQVLDSPDSIRAGLAEFWETAGQHMREARWEWDRVYVDRLSPDAAVLTATWSIPHLAPTGRPHLIRGAWTAVFRRIEGHWKIIVEHLSEPR